MLNSTSVKQMIATVHERLPRDARPGLAGQNCPRWDGRGTTNIYTRDFNESE